MRFPALASQSVTGGLALCGLLYTLALWSGTGPARLLNEAPIAPRLAAWIDIPRPREIFLLEAPEFAGAAKVYEARRHRTGGGRQDVLEFGGLDGDAPMLRLVFYRPGKEALPDPPFFVDLARRAAETGHAIARAAQPAALATRFGAFEVADVSLARNGSPARGCLGFRFNTAETDLRIAGFACGGGKAPLPSFPSKPALACLIGRIDLAPTSEDGGLVWFFAAHETVRDPNCPPPARLSAADDTAAIERQGKSAQ